MPVGRYFIFVGGFLLALLFLVDWCFPSVPGVSPQETSSIDRPAIRIKSTYKWPEKVVIDTNLPTIIPSMAAVVAAAEPVTTGTVASPQLEAFAELKPPAPQVAKHHPPARPMRRIARATRTTRVAAYPAMPTWPPGW